MSVVDRFPGVFRVQTEREKRLLILSGLVTAGFLAAVLFHLVQGFVLGHPWPYNTYLFNPVDRFNDLLYSVGAASTLDPYFQHASGSVSTYFPFTYVVLVPLGQLPPRLTVAIFLASSVIALVALIVWWNRGAGPDASVRRSSLIAGLVFIASLYPLHFALDRGNFDAWIAPMCMGFVLLVRSRRYWPAVCVIAAAAAMKGFPAAFLLLLILERRYVHTLIAVMLTGGLTVASSALFVGGVSRTLAGFRDGLALFQAEYVIKNGSLHYSSDFFNLLKLGSKSGSLYGLWPYDPEALLLPYHAVVFAIATLVVYFVLFVPTRFWRRVYAICLLVLVFPDVANDYKLLMLLPGVLCLVDDAGDGRHARRVLVLTALLLIPKHYLFLHNDISISCVINPVLVWLLLWQVLGDGTAWKASFSLAPARLRWYLHLGPAPAPFESTRA